MPPMSPLVYLRWLGRKLSFSNDNINRERTIETIRNGMDFSGVSLWILVIAIVMASLGLNVNSTAVIIGAMLISPLMGPIMAIGMGLGIYDLSMMRIASRAWLAAFLISLVASTIYFLLSPLKVAGSELLARTEPTIYDVLIAFFGGLAGILAGSSKLSQSNVIPGVAIATALMPPICTAGFSLANGEWTNMLGALYLFVINSVFISLATFLVVRLMKFPVRSYLDKKQETRIHRAASTIALLVIVPSVFLTYKLVMRYVFTDRADRFIQAEIPTQDRYILKRDLDFNAAAPKITVTVLGRPLDSADIAAIAERLPAYKLSDARLFIQQGFEDSSRQTVIFDRFNQLLKVNSNAISNVYGILDSLKQKVELDALDDSLQTQIARESKALLPDLKSFFIGRDLYYKVDSARFDTILHVYASFSALPKEEKEMEYLNWLKARLNKPTVLLEKKLEAPAQ